MEASVDEAVYERLVRESVRIEDFLPDVWELFVALVILVFVIPVLLIARMLTPHTKGRHRA